MLITPFELQDEPLLFNVSLAPGAIDYAPDTQQIGPLPVEGKADLVVEHRGPADEVHDIRVRAAYHGTFEVACARCLDPVTLPLKGEFDLLFRPEKADAEPGERAITPDETEIGYYGEVGLLLEDVVREQVMLTLPGRTLCKADCKGLCPHCGQNLNTGTCTCARTASSDPADSRWHALQSLQATLKQ